MWGCSGKCFMLLMSTIIVLFTQLPQSQAVIYSNSTRLEPVPDDTFHGLPVYFKSNVMIRSLHNAEQMHEHIQQILRPLSKYILSEDVTLYGPQRRQDGGGNGQDNVVVIEQYDLPFIAAAQIGAYTFTCRQTNGDLVIFNPTLTGANQLRSIQSFTEFLIHPRPGIWWWTQCVTFETGGAGMGITGVQKPGGDSGIDPNALKSLVG